MAEQKKKPTVTNAAGYEEAKAAAQQGKSAIPQGSATGLRVGAVILWVLAIVFEILALLVVLGKIHLGFMSSLAQLIVFLVLDLACVIIGSQLWKKANHIRPASEKEPLKFWLWNNLGLIVCIVAFVPFIILILSNKNMDKKTKAIATVVAVVALLIGGVSSYDWNPVSVEQQQAAIQAISDDVYWSPFGHVYHTHDDCQALNQSDQLTYGTVEQAIAANRTRLCSFCAKRDSITGVVTDEVPVDELVEELAPTGTDG